MPRKEIKLSWRESDKRWSKYYQGKHHYLGYGTSKSDHASKAAAWEIWLKLKAELDEQQQRAAVADRRFARDYEMSIIPTWEDALGRAVEFSNLTEHPETLNDVQFCTNILRHLRGLVKDESASLPDPFRGGFNFHLYDTPDEDLSEASRRLKDDDRFWGQAATVEASKSLGGNVRIFLEQQIERAERGEISRGRYDVLRCGLADFERAIGGETALAEVNAATLVGYHRRIMAEVAGKSISDRTAGDRMQSVKQFLRWAFELGTLETLPRNLLANSKTLSIKKRPRAVEVLPLDHIGKLLAAANERTKLYLLLMLNCGMYPVDIAELRQSEVNWKAGRIIRKRTKTKDHKDVPTVNYKLWPETFSLLKACRSKDSERALTNEKGGPLRIEKISGDRKAQRSDAIKSSYSRLCRKLKLPCLPLKRFRKTAASKLAEIDAYRSMVAYYLGHAPSNMAEQSYIKPEDEPFDRALDWLGEQFKLTGKAGGRKSS